MLLFGALPVLKGEKKKKKVRLREINRLMHSQEKAVLKIEIFE